MNLFVQQTASSSTYCLLLKYFDAGVFEDKGLVCGHVPRKLTRLNWHHFVLSLLMCSSPHGLLYVFPMDKSFLSPGL